MNHTTLYRKWRPRRFAEVSGQEAVVRTLRRAIETDRVSHAYLFSGPRGTGKTSSAKVLAMGLNCRNSDGPTPEPCGECESCRGIINGSSMDVVEMDAASNRGIDEIRDLRDRVNLAPASGRVKVYIIDEVHMLTTEAFNALLKMLEEPPEHVVFILATTEKHKVLPTIISRCQSFDFRRPGVQTLADKLAEIAGAEEIDAEPEALTVIARAGGGSFRDAEGLLDQLSSFSEGKVTAAMVRELLGSAGPEALLETTDALAERRAADALRVLDRLASEGRDLGQFATELISHLRNLMLLPHAPEVALSEVGAEEREPLQRQSERVPTAEAVREIEAISEAVGRIRRGSDAKLELELCFMKLARDYAEPSVEALMSRLESLERAAHNGGFGTTVGEEPEVNETRAEPSDKELSGTPEPRPEAALSGESGEDVSRTADVHEDGSGGRSPGGVSGADLRSRWGSVMQELKRRRRALTAAVYGEARVEGFDGETITLAFTKDQDFHVGMAKERKHAGYLTEVLEERFGVSPRLEIRSAGPDGAGPSGEAPPEDAPPDEPRRAEAGEGDTEAEIRARSERPGASEERLAEASGPAGNSPEAGGGDDIIRDQPEVFEMAREFFGSSHDKGS